MSDAALAIGTANAYAQATELATQAGSTGEGLYHLLALRDQTADWCDSCLNFVDQLRDLNPNWDSYGANPVSVDSIQVAKQLLCEFAEVTGIGCPRVSASPAGHVALSWEWANHSRELDLEILPDGVMRYSYLDETQPARDREGETSDPTLIAYLLTQW